MITARSARLAACAVLLGKPHVNAQSRHADSIGFCGISLDSCAEYIGAIGVHGARRLQIQNSARSETLGIYAVSFACSTETIGI